MDIKFFVAVFLKIPPVIILGMVMPSYYGAAVTY